MSFAAMMLVAFGVDALLGWPQRVFQAVGHPVTWLGRLIGWLDRRLNDGGRPACLILKGGATVLIVLAAALIPALILQAALPQGWAGVVMGGFLAWPLVAARALHDHVAAVARPLAQGDMAEARRAVSMIVGRDPAQLDQAGIARAALESLAENTSDGVVAPLFWGAVAGLPGIAVYKAINTMDSMIGHRSERHEYFGKIAARLDDLVNLIPARLTGLIFAIVSSARKQAMRIMLRDARRHRSPNAGWPEAAMAGALGIRLSGPRIYGTRIADEPWLNAGAKDPVPRDLRRGLALYRRAMVLGAATLAPVAWFWG
ncbi:adenosylcobinamide-phosphate synthase CbiB [Paracoccus ravus]|uniref:adenosylcobinamide-phosphate synthase CbiB n=1 Tax=Paracoccus ravus TaxID=2447760 RepID=UPI00106EDE80|nr:adenosylcobinamide-phosphate synthase CbiB [Paracoccus ravus]